MLKSVTIKRFKKLENISIELDKINVMIGANNSGKSSVLQAIHLAVSVAQTTKAIGGVNWSRDKLEMTFNPSQLLYSPVSNIQAIATNGLLKEDREKRVEIEFATETGDSALISIRRGRNRNLSVAIEGKNLGEALQDMSQPFSIYAPGLAGIPKEEGYFPMGSIRRIVARGDANLVLRNVFYHLKKNAEPWARFIENVRSVFGNINVNVYFEEEKDEYLTANIQVDDSSALPLDAMGTSFLQAAQLFSYVELFSPKVMLLDEPDSHLHPNNQRKLSEVIKKLSYERDVQIFISTHSRHLLNEQDDKSKLFWLSNGAIVEDCHQNNISILMDLGALDTVDYFANGDLKFLVATEDKNTEGIENLLWSSGFNQSDTEIVSYKGCTKLESAIVLGNFVKEKARNIVFIVHLDRDYMGDDEASEVESALKSQNIELFITEGNDIESYYINKRYLSSCFSQLSESRAEKIIEKAVSEVKVKSIEAIVNLKTERAFRKRNRGGSSPNHGSIATEANDMYDQNPREMTRGKITLSKIKSLIQAEIGATPILFRTSEFLKVKNLEDILNKIETDE